MTKLCNIMNLHILGIVLIASSVFASHENQVDLASSVRSMTAISGEMMDSFAERVTGRHLLSQADGYVAWRGRMDPVNNRSYFASAIAVNKCNGNKQCTTSLGSYPYEEYIIDPTGDSNEPVLKIGYPAGAWCPGADIPGGILFYAYPYKSVPTTWDSPVSSESATLEYEVYFPPDFDFVKGGKLPGMSGGGGYGRGCGGGVNPDTCFSFRVMWRRDGMGEAYVYAKHGLQGADFCTKYPDCQSVNFAYPCTVCDLNHGISFARGAFQFQRGAWQQLRVHITLNDVGTNNGHLGLEYNGKMVASYDQMAWRASGDMHIEGVEMASWFGGGDSSWAPSKDTYTLIRNVKVYRTGPSTGTIGAGGARSAIATPGPLHQTVIEEVIVAGL